MGGGLRLPGWFVPPFTKFDNIAIKKSQVPLWTREVGALLNPNDFFFNVCFSWSAKNMARQCSDDDDE